MSDDVDPGGNSAAARAPAGASGASQAYEQIRRAIVEGRYRPGQRLVEQRVAEEFDFSRTPVREALRRLQAEGLVDLLPNRGARVRDVTLADLEDLYDLRARLESYAAELAAARRTDADLGELNGGIADFAAALAAHDGDDLALTRAVDAANRRVHDAILGAARNDRLRRTVQSVVDIPLVFQAFRQFDRSGIERSHLFHQLIRDAIAAGDGDRAARLMHEHVLQGRDALLPHLEAHEAGVDGVFED